MVERLLANENTRPTDAASLRRWEELNSRLPESSTTKTNESQFKEEVEQKLKDDSDGLLIEPV